MEWLARTVELASQQVIDDPEEDVFHGDVLWFGADGSVLLAHEECGEAVSAPVELWVSAMLMIHPVIWGQ